MLKKILERLEKENSKLINIGLFTHKSCDFDAVCSTLTLGNYLNDKLKGKVNIYPIIEKTNLYSNVNTGLNVYNDIENIDLDYAIALDVNEEDRLYGLDLFNKVKIENRFLFDHHTGNRKELEVLDKQKIVLPKSSSTCEVIGLELLKENYLDEANSFNLYLGMASDTVGFSRQTSEFTNKLIEVLSISAEVKKQVIDSLIELTRVQRELYEAITLENSDFENLRLYKLKLSKDEIDKTKELKNKFIEEKITPSELDIISILIIDCGSSIFLKIRKNENSNLDILTIAEKCNGGGHSNRTAGRFYNTNYEEVLSYINRLYQEYENNRKIIVKK